jgi:hypothetical protein
MKSAREIKRASDWVLSCVHPPYWTCIPHGSVVLNIQKLQAHPHTYTVRMIGTRFRNEMAPMELIISARRGKKGKKKKKEKSGGHLFERLFPSSKSRVEEEKRSRGIVTRNTHIPTSTTTYFSFMLAMIQLRPAEKNKLQLFHSVFFFCL